MFSLPLKPRKQQGHHPSILNLFCPKGGPRLLINFARLVNRLRNLNTKLMRFLQYFALNFEIIWSCLRRISFTCHLKDGSSSMFFATECSAISTGFEAMISFNGIQITVPSFHLTFNLEPLVVFLECSFPPRLLINSSFLFNEILPAELSLIYFITW